MYFSTDERELIRNSAKHLPEIYVAEMMTIIENVLNNKPINSKRKVLVPITEEDYD